jgi:hypothetical protein
MLDGFLLLGPHAASLGNRIQVFRGKVAHLLLQKYPSSPLQMKTVRCLETSGCVYSLTHRVISQKNGILNYTTAETSTLTQNQNVSEDTQTHTRVTAIRLCKHLYIIMYTRT